jgi:SAM-dependent methyltransferase
MTKATTPFLFFALAFAPACATDADKAAPAHAEHGEGAHDGARDGAHDGAHDDAKAAHGEHEYTPGEHKGHHRFNEPDKWAKRFEDPSRDAWQRPDDVIGWLELAPTSVVADIGAATGYFPVRIAKQVPEGRVYGVDIEQEMVDYLNARAKKEGLANLQAVLGEPADPKLPDAVDVVLVVNTYHHIEDRTAYFGRLVEKVKPGGRLCIVDFKKGELPFGPPDAMKIAPDKVTEELAAAGWTSRAQHDLEHQYVLIFDRPKEG